MKTLTSLNEEVRPVSVSPLFLPLAITAFRALEGYSSLAIIAVGAFGFTVPGPKWEKMAEKWIFRPT